ncbi:MAG: hypothetical protein KYX69_10310 [Sphingomonas sp.]|uniref:hypothetical protein n=1 Tax=Sphingomonas sp. TaxID=28214 RepID=UPI00262FDAD1|nr:hypothetical protein [Sphingomonas sp.]MDK2768095.1 hypothetical protein [Sphingomonas sp.]
MLPMQAAATPRETHESPTDILNAVSVSGPQLEAALEVLAALPAQLRASPHAQALALQAYAREAGFAEEAASAALHARVTALAKWTVAHDPERQSDARSVLEAAARFPLGDTEAGIGFEPGGFQELILFIEDLPF